MNKKMSFMLFIMDYPPFSVYGVERHNERLASYLSSKGYFTVVFTRGYRNPVGSHFENKNMLIYRVPSLCMMLAHSKLLRFILRFRYLYLILRYIPVVEYTLHSIFYAPIIVKKYGISLIHGSEATFGGWQATLVSFIVRRKLVITLHGYIVDYYSHYNKLPLTYYFLKSASAVIVQKTSAVKTLVKWGIPRNKIFYIEEGAIDIERFKPSLSYIARLKRYVTFVGRLIEFKGPELLIEAVPQIVEVKADVEFLLVGEGDLRLKLEEKIRDLNLNSKVHFLGIVSNVESVLQQTDVFVSLSPYNNFSDLAMLEAMACGIPIVATNSGETHKTIKDGWNGLLIEPGNAKQLSEKILYILNNSDFGRKIGENARKTVIKDYSLEKFGKRILNVFHRAREFSITFLEKMSSTQRTVRSSAPVIERSEIFDEK